MGVDQLNGALKNVVQKPWEREMDQRHDIENQLKNLELPPLALTKGELNYWGQRPEIRYRADDVIEIQPRTGKDGVEWWVRNKTISESTPEPILPGNIVEIPRNEIKSFYSYWRENDPQGAYHIEKIIDDYSSNPSRRVLAFEEPNGRKTGWMYLLDDGSGGVHVTWIQTMTSEENRGVGGAMMENLKQNYRAIELNAVSKHPKLKYEIAQQRLTNFYKSHGLVSATTWRRPPLYISLDDKYEAGKWRKAGDQVAVDSRWMSKEEMARIFMANYATRPELRQTLSEELAEKMDEWLESWREMETGKEFAD